jgi:hydroxyacylglutathione hydrolase
MNRLDHSKIEIDNLSVRCFQSSILMSNMYIITKENHCIIIDPFISESALNAIIRNNINVDYIILTHEHYDHISGVNWLKKKFPCSVICSDECGKAIVNPKKNLSEYFDILLSLIPDNIDYKIESSIKPYSCSADITFHDNMVMDWMGHNIELVSTPGHSKGSICVLIDDAIIFTGDSLLRDYSIITRIPGGSVSEYESHTKLFLQGLATGMIVKPGHFSDFILEK